MIPDHLPILLASFLRAVVRSLPPSPPAPFVLRLIQGARSMRAVATPPKLAPNVASIEFTYRDDAGPVTVSTAGEPLSFLVAGATLTYSAVAVGTNGVKSDPSAEVSVPVPTPHLDKPDAPGPFAVEFFQD